MDPDEFAAAEADEPVARYRRWLIDERGIGEDALAAIEGEVAAEVEAAVEAAKAADPPPPEELLHRRVRRPGGGAPMTVTRRRADRARQVDDGDPVHTMSGGGEPGPGHGHGRGSGGLPPRRGHRGPDRWGHEGDEGPVDQVRAGNGSGTRPISEQAIVGAAIGASLAGMRPVAEVMLMDFFAVAMDQVANHAAKLRYMSGGRTHVPITIRTSVGGGRQFGAQHSQSLEAWMMHVPGLKVAVPSTPGDAKGLLYSLHLRRRPVHLHGDDVAAVHPGAGAGRAVRACRSASPR